MAKTNAKGFTIEVKAENNEVFGVQHVGISDRSELTFTVQGQSTPVARIDHNTNTLTLTTNGQTITTTVDKVTMSHTQNLEFTIDTDAGKVTYKIEGNSISKKGPNEKGFEVIETFDKPFDVSLPKDLPKQMANKSITMKEFPSQMFDMLATSYGFSSYTSSDSKLKLLKNGDQMFVVRGAKIVPAYQATYVMEDGKAIVGLSLTKGSGVLKSGATSGIGFELPLEEMKQVGKFIEGKELEESKIRKNTDGLILDFKQPSKTKDATKTARIKPPEIPRDVPHTPHTPEPHTPEPHTPEPHTPEPHTPTPTPEEPTPSTKPEEKKEDAPLKKIPIVSGNLAFVIACISGALLIAGVGVGAIFLPVVFLVSAFLALTGSTLGTLYYTEKEPKSKGGKDKSKDKTKTATKDKNKDKDKSKDKDKDKTSDKSSKKEKKTKRAKVETSEYVPETPVVSEIAASGPVAEPPRDIVSTKVMTKETMENLKQAIASEQSTRGDASKAMEHQDAVTQILDICKTINPNNDMVSTFNAADQELIQATNDIITSHIAFESATNDLDQANNEQASAAERASQKPNSKKEQENLEAANNSVEYNSSTQTSTEELLGKCIDSLATIVDKDLEEINSREKELSEIARAKKNLAERNAHLSSNENKNLNIRALASKLNDIVRTRGENSEDYIEVINLCISVSKDLEYKSEMTPAESHIKSLCDDIIKSDNEKLAIDERKEKLSKEFSEMIASEHPTINHEEESKKIFEQMNAASEEQTNINDRMRVTLNDLLRSTNAYVNDKTAEQGAEVSK